MRSYESSKEKESGSSATIADKSSLRERIKYWRFFSSNHKRINKPPFYTNYLCIDLFFKIGNMNKRETLYFKMSYSSIL